MPLSSSALEMIDLPCFWQERSGEENSVCVCARASDVQLGPVYQRHFVHEETVLRKGPTEGPKPTSHGQGMGP